MKKKYSTLLNFALAGCLATTLAACGSDGDKNKTGMPGAVNQSDPQIPSSIWWLADAGFVGFRVVCEPDGKAGE